MLLNMKLAVEQFQQAADLSKQQELIQAINLNLKPVASMAKRKKNWKFRKWGEKRNVCPIYGRVARADDVCVSDLIDLCDEGSEKEGEKEEVEWQGENEEHEENHNYCFQLVVFWSDPKPNRWLCLFSVPISKWICVKDEYTSVYVQLIRMRARAVSYVNGSLYVHRSFGFCAAYTIDVSIVRSPSWSDNYNNFPIGKKT